MTEQAIQDNQKTIVAFVAGLLIGGLLVYMFAKPQAPAETVEEGETALEEVAKSETTKTEVKKTEEKKEVEVAKPEMKTGKGDIKVADQNAGSVVKIGGATFPNDEGWIGVRDYSGGQLGGLLGVARFSNEQGLVPAEVELLRATKAGNEYAMVFYSESGDRMFNLADDVQVGDVAATFSAK